MDQEFAEDIKYASSFTNFSKEDANAFEEADAAAEELAMPEYEHYMNHEFDTEAIGIARKHGLFGIPISKEQGGMGLRQITHSLVQMRLGQLGLGFATLYDVQTFIAANAISRWGTEQQKGMYLKPMANGDSIFSFALTEPEAGSDPSIMSTTYEKDGQDFIINGTKYLITNGSICNYMILFAKSKAGGNITAFIIDSKAEGFGVDAVLKEKVGLFTSDTAMLSFENVRVQKEDILGTEGKGLHVAYSALVNGRIGIGSACIGVIEASLSSSLKRAKERVQHGKEIGKHQLIQQHIAAMRHNLEMARWPLLKAIMAKEASDKNPDDKQLLNYADLHSALAKRIASRLAFESADKAVQVHGGFGYSLMSPVGQLFLDSRVARIYEGTDEIQDLKIASDILGQGYEAYD
ncbi:MAG: acyl-CoA dehydrogenase family protein [Candidatus Marsarchaeota archaeon]|nr:acyl-CoA dehydrogenase family protein [Candidatus Marsarchaeota archaeon]